MDPKLQSEPVEVHYYPRDGSVFLDTHYLIKGVAGAIFWKLAREHTQPKRSEFSSRELRLAGHELRLPDVQDNLSARLTLLQRRLVERKAALQIHKTGRGRFRVSVLRPMRLMQVPAHTTTQPPTPADDLDAVRSIDASECHGGPTEDPALEGPSRNANSAARTNAMRESQGTPTSCTPDVPLLA